MTHAVEVRNVRRVFRSRAGMLAPERVVRAVDGVSFALAAGDVLGIVGESGCGKSTLARVVLGLLPASEGEVLVDGRSLADDGPARARAADPAGVPGPVTPRSIRASACATSSACRWPRRATSRPRSSATA